MANDGSQKTLNNNQGRTFSDSRIGMLRRYLFSIMIFCCLVFCIVLALDLLPILRGGFGWQWGYQVPAWLRVLPLLFIMVVYVCGLTRVKNSRPYQLWCFVGAIILPFAALYILDDPIDLLARRVMGGDFTGQHMAGAQITDLNVAAGAWPETMKSYFGEFGLPGVVPRPIKAVHIGVNPPALPMMFYGMDQLLARIPGIADSMGMPLRYYVCNIDFFSTYSNAQVASAWFNILMPVWTAFTVFPLYRLGGKYAAGWWPLIPSIAFFTPVWNLLYPLMTLIAYMILKIGITDIQAKRTKGLLHIVLAGLIVSVATFTALPCLALMGFFGLYSLFSFIQWWQMQKISLNSALYRMLLTSLVFTLSVLGIWIVYYLAFDVTLYDILQTGLTSHFGLERPYAAYLFLNLYDFALFTGIPLVLIALSAIRRPRSWAEVDPLALALIFTLLIMDNFARGETGRHWVYFVPFILIWAAQQATQLSARQAMAVTLVQALNFLIISGVLINVPGLPKAVIPASPEVATATTSLLYPVKFGEYLTLLGMKTVPQEDRIDLTLLWRADRQMTIPYSFSALVVDSNGQPIGQSHVFRPFDSDNPATYYPTTCWRPGGMYAHTAYIPLETKLAPSTYWISFAMLDVLNLERVPVIQPNHPVDSQIGLGPVEVH